MSAKEFEDEDQARAYSIYRPDPPSQLAHLIIDYLGEKLNPPYLQAIDVACGSGQSTLILAPHFQQVIGLDVSEAQIKEAKKKRLLPNIRYYVGEAERLPAVDNSVDLITAGTCLHWLDTKKFFAEVQRVLVDDGVLAVYFSKNIYPIYGDPDIDNKLRELTDEVLYEKLKPYRSKNVTLLLENYKDIYFPFKNVRRGNSIKQKILSNVGAAAGYIRSMSTFQNCYKANPESADDLLNSYTRLIMEVIEAESSDPEETPLHFLKEYLVILCKK